MKRFKIFLLTAIAGLAFSSCDKEESSADVSRQTDYPLIEVQGESPMFVELGTTFTDPGATATEGGEELQVSKTVVGNYQAGIVPAVDVNTADHYTITYSAENKDGFEGTATRDVFVVKTGDLVSSIEGLYTSTVVRDGVSGPEYTDIEYILIWQNADDTYTITDGIGGYYAFGRNYGPAYLAPAVVTANDIPTNDFSYTNFGVGAFGGVATMKNMMVDPVAKTITFTTDWDAGYTFEVTLTQVQF